MKRRDFLLALSAAGLVRADQAAVQLGIMDDALGLPTDPEAVAVAAGLGFQNI